jgi:ferric-dicitrate binding protein FerR (iron transport regulator)
MNKQDNNAHFDENIKALLTSAVEPPDPAFETRLVNTVLDAVRKERRASRLRPTGVQKLAFSLSAALAVVLIVVLVHFVRTAAPACVASVKSFYGFVILTDGKSSERVADTAEVRSGQSVQTLSGSKAEIVLSDQSKLYTRPRTSVQIREEKSGGKVMLQHGFLSIEAAAQPPGKTLTIETPDATARVLGTELDVYVGQEPSGEGHTRVSVTSGRVELEAAGQRILLQPNTEGIVEGGQAPLRRCLVPEVNELTRFVELTQQLAGQAGVQAGSPAIIDVRDDGTATVWTVVIIENKSDHNLVTYSLPNKRNVSGVRAFTMDGSVLPVITQGDTMQIDLAGVPLEPGHAIRVILKTCNLKGLFRSKGHGAFLSDIPKSTTSALALLQFRLPESVRLDHVSPEPIERRTIASRQFVTVAANATLPDPFE